MELRAHLTKLMSFFQKIFVVQGVFLNFLFLSFSIKEGNSGILAKNFINFVIEKCLIDDIRSGLSIVSFTLFKSCLCAIVFLLMDVRVSANSGKLPVDDLCCINVDLFTKYFSDLILQNRCHKWLLVGPRGAASSVEVAVSIDEIAKSHRFTTRVRYELELILHKVKNSAELGLSTFIENRGNGSMRNGFFCFCQGYDVQTSVEVVVEEVL